MNICLICRNILRDRGGVESYTKEMAKALEATGNTVHIILEQNGDLTLEDLNPNIKMHPIVLNKQPFPGYWKLDRVLPIDDWRFSLAASKKVQDIQINEKIDVIEITDYFRQGFVVAQNKLAPTILRLHGWFFNRQNGRINPLGGLNLKERFTWWMQQKTIENVDLITAVSSDFANFAGNIWKIDQKKVRIIPNAINTTIFKPNNNIEKEPAILYVARLTKNKGIFVLEAAIPQILKKFPNLKFYFAGKDMALDNSEMTVSQYLKNKFSEHSNKLICLGEISQEQLIKLYQECAVSVFPSIYEAFGLACLEAMACGSAVVASDIGGFRDIVSSGKDGILFKSEQPDELATAVIKILANPDLQKKLSQEARITTETKYNYHNILKQTLNTYNEAILHYKTS